jgi:asparagine synthase (glutamine-hydrolysing)
MVACQHHRGPDASGVFVSPSGTAGLTNNRLSILDLSEKGRQPMSDATGRFWIVLNGEIYNYLELRRELASNFNFQTGTDTEVLLAAYERWGEACLDRLIGMFAFAIWDEQTRTLFAARDRFGVKPLYYSLLPSGELAIASEIKTLHAIGVRREADSTMWATYLTYGLYDHGDRTFWDDVKSLAPGAALSWQDGRMQTRQWYDLASATGPDLDTRPEQEVMDEYRALLEESVRLRFRSDVPVGINLSGGLDSSILLGLVHAVQGNASQVCAFTFVTGDERYDELHAVEHMLERTRHPHHVCSLAAEEVIDLALKVQAYQDEPFGGLPTLAYSRIFERARELGVTVLLDGQGHDEQWAGYDYYAAELDGSPHRTVQPASGPVQGSHNRATRPECLLPEFRAQAAPFFAPAPFPDALRNIQYRDAKYTKIPRALRFNDRISMMHSIELREPFLDHRLFELALRQPEVRKISNGVHKSLLRRIARGLVPAAIFEPAKRPLQTPQREWLRGPLKDWVTACIDTLITNHGDAWIDAKSVRQQWQKFLQGEGDNSFYIWQWVSLSIAIEATQEPAPVWRRTRSEAHLSENVIPVRKEEHG